MFEALSHVVRLGSGRTNYLARIDSPNDWMAVAIRHGRHTVARTETVKFLIDLHDDKRTYFLNASKWPTHWWFVQQFIDPNVDYHRFNTVEYRSQDRRFVLGSVMHYLDGDHWAVELDPSDLLAADWIAWMFGHIAQRVTMVTNLRFRPVTLSQAKRIEPLGDQLPVLSREAINAAVKYQPLVLGVAYGYLRLVHGPLDVSSVRPYDIVVTDHVPVEIPPVAALVTSELQAPLAHVAVLSRNRNTPDMALCAAIDLEVFQRLEGELVKLTVAGQDYSLERADRADAEIAWKAARPHVAYRLDRDLDAAGLLDVDSLPAGAVCYVGAKAAQVGELCAIEGLATPGGTVLPFSAYAAHLESAGLTDEIDAMLADPAFHNDASLRADRLACLRAAVAAHPVAADVLTAIDQKLRAMPHCGRFVFRSSTNAEDLAGFNGAGLYESAIVPADPSAEQIAEALRLVWASVWLQRAFEEREWYRIDHRSVAMAVLIQPFIDGAVATGVAITENPFRHCPRSVFINSQTVGTTVTSAIGNELPEQYLVTGDGATELINHSSISKGALILSESDVRVLADQLLRIHDMMLPTHAECANAMDVEFALTTERRFVILQARPHNLVHNLDRVVPPPPKRGLLDWVMYRMRRVIHRLFPDRPSRPSLNSRPPIQRSVMHSDNWSRAVRRSN